MSPMAISYHTRTRPLQQAAVMGMVDDQLRVERLSDDAEALFGCAIDDLLGLPFISLIAEHDVPPCLVALTEAASSRSGVSVYLELRSHDSGGPASPPLECELVLLPMEPSPCCAFVFLPAAGAKVQSRVATELGVILPRLGREVAVHESALPMGNGLSERVAAGWSDMTPRELDLLRRLLQGDRVPTIARELFLAQSTIRSHLASIFRKLDVKSQPELLELFRDSYRSVELVVERTST